ncbi:GNAT family N-acetyltransferase [Tepidibacter aestuarii]|uniref:GNAT family N-acetyltransferase n=1 Tax=Tepidibacter aestuarii TaxID=2925782 RepID=UPI0020BE659B|nr:GNAT family N-acetyltransferase [Tepidibacter aestuarii]CAH2213172.1 N-acetyltransferase domain-containing protein [Tepidibacter aestuarii]
MGKNDLLEQVSKIEEIELKLTVFNAKRALSKIDKKLETKTIGNCSLLFDINSPDSIYYNRVKGFGMKDLDKLENILGIYSEQGIIPSFDMTPNNINEAVSLALLKHGFTNSEQLVFMQLTPEAYTDINKGIKIVKVTEKNAEEFVNIIISSEGGMDISSKVIGIKKQYFYQNNFYNYISYIGNEVAGVGSLFISDNEGYIANDFTFKGFRGKGGQTALLKYRINKAKELGLEKLYTDVEFGSISHNNMEKLGFKTVFINSFYTKLNNL